MCAAPLWISSGCGVAVCRPAVGSSLALEAHSVASRVLLVPGCVGPLQVALHAFPVFRVDPELAQDVSLRPHSGSLISFALAG